jgi:hypothetical protein
MLKFAHIINPVKVGNNSDLYYAQPITFETMNRAKKYAQDEVDVELLSAQYPEDKEIIPDFIYQTPDLEKSILDYGHFQTNWKLPLIKDILSRLYENSDADYFIFSNVDISLYPHFYISVKSLIEKGYDSIVINRRTISDKYYSIQDLPIIYTEPGKIHEGIDCFIFKKEDFQKFNLANSFVGSGPVGMCIVFNMLCYSTNFTWIQDAQFTFHIGDDKKWMNPKLSEFNIFNFKQLQEILSTLTKQITGEKHKEIALLKSLSSVKKMISMYENKEIVFEEKLLKNGFFHPKKIIELFALKKFEDIKNGPDRSFTKTQFSNYGFIKRIIIKAVLFNLKLIKHYRYKQLKRILRS